MVSRSWCPLHFLPRVSCMVDMMHTVQWCWHWARVCEPSSAVSLAADDCPAVSVPSTPMSRDVYVISTPSAPDKNIIHNRDRKPPSRHPRCCWRCSRHCFSTFRRFPQNITHRDIKADTLMSSNDGVSSYDVIVCFLTHHLATFKLLPCQKLTDYGKIVTQLTII